MSACALFLSRNWLGIRLARWALLIITVGALAQTPTPQTSAPYAHRATGRFTNTEMEQHVVSTLNWTADFNRIFASVHGGNNFATEAITAAVNVPSTAKASGAYPFSAYVVNNSGDPSVQPAGFYSQSIVTANGGTAWGINPFVGDNPTTRGTWLIGGEFDVAVNGSPATVVGINITGGGAGTLPPGSRAIAIGGRQPSTYFYGGGIELARGITHGPGLILGGALPTNPTSSMGIQFAAFDASGAVHTAVLSASPSGTLVANSGLQANSLTLSSTSAVVCDATHRGTFQYIAGGPGMRDAVQVCAKDAGENYAWRRIY